MLMDELDEKIQAYNRVDDFVVIAWYMKGADEPVYKAYIRADGPSDDPVGPWRPSYEEAQLDILSFLGGLDTMLSLIASLQEEEHDA